MQCQVGYKDLISNKHEWDNCFIKNNREILQDLADFALQEQPEDNFLVAMFWAWYNCSYSMAAKPIKSLELHYTMILSIFYSITDISFTYLQLNDIISESFNKMRSRTCPFGQLFVHSSGSNCLFLL